MFSKRSLSGVLLATSIGAAAALAMISPDPALAGDGGYCGKLKKPEVQKLCDKNKSKDENEKAIRDKMKEWRGIAKKKDEQFKKCSACHEKSSGGPLNGDAEKLWPVFKKLAGF